VREFFSYPNPANNKAVRLVAGCVAILALTGLVTGWDWLIPVLAAGFILRMAAGPKIDPLAFVAVRVARRLGKPARTPGPPKRFAQAMGATVTTAGTILVFGFGIDAAAPVVFAMILLFATLESVFNFCVGCTVFAGLMRLGIIPEEVCEECADIWLHRERPAGS
jgi:hypothetical protein